VNVSLQVSVIRLWEAASGEVTQITRPVLQTIEEVDRLKPIDPYQDGTLPEVIKATRILAKELGGHVCLLSTNQGRRPETAELVDCRSYW
jgi:hypothetical protein